MLVTEASAAQQVGVGELAVLQDREEALGLEFECPEPRAEQRPRVVGAKVACRLAAAGIALAQQPLDDLHRRHGVRCARGADPGQRPDGERDGRVGPLGRAALLPPRGNAPGPDVGQEFLGGLREWRLSERAADIDSGVVIGPTDGGAAMSLDVHKRRQVEFLGP